MISYYVRSEEVLRSLRPLFLINSAIVVDKLSVFDTDTRVEHTLGTLKSIYDFYGDKVDVLILDMSQNISGARLYELIRPLLEFKRNIPNIDFYNIQTPETAYFSLHGQRSLSEIYGFIHFFNQTDKYTDENVHQTYSHVYKLSGRYTLNANFKPDDLPTRAYVFAKSEPTWMEEARQKVFTPPLDRLFKLRLWHMDATLFGHYLDMLDYLRDVCGGGIDIEHGIYLYLRHYKQSPSGIKIVEKDRIGVSGFIAPSGEFIDE